MGIKGFITKITSTFNCIEKPKYVDILCVDMNTLLHNVCHKSTNKETFKKFLYKDLKKIIKMIKPKDTIALFTDGQAVLAKAKTQKKRRIKYLYNKPKGISTLHLTSGTPFMEFVDSIINDYLSQLHESSSTNIKTYYSPSTEKNEGELKLFDWLRQNSPTNKKTVIYGQDSDLVVLALQTEIPDMYIMNDYKYIAIDNLVRSFTKHIPRNFSLHNHPVKKDFALMSMLLGNDYLPNISSFNSLWKTYVKFHSQINFLVRKNNTIDFVNLKKLLKLIPTSPIQYKTALKRVRINDDLLI